MISFDGQLLMGWDIHQWAVAIKRVGIGGTQMKHANKCRRDYLNRFGQNPLEFQLIGVQAEGDYDLAAALFEQTEFAHESVEEQEKDSSFGDHSREDYQIDQDRQNLWERGV